ncbi:MAG: T9SS type A sorting domain-containing protein [Chloroherpetonaceae bacterium]
MKKKTPTNKEMRSSFVTLPSVGEILNPDGTLRLERDGGYSLDGYELQMDASGAPRAVPKGEAQTDNTTSGTWGTGFNLQNGVNGDVLALAVYNGELYVGGRFTQAGDKEANCVARWDGTSWNTLGTGSNNGVNDWVYALAVYNGELIVGGDFTQASDKEANYIARWNGTSWNSLGEGARNGVSGRYEPYVNALAVYGNSLFLGGNFTLVNVGDNPIPSSHIAQWTANTQEDHLPKGYALLQNYPNPFNPTTIITYQLPVASNVSLKVYDASGKEVMTLVQGRQVAGTYLYILNASSLASGVYSYRLQASATNEASEATIEQTKDMMLVK